MKRFFYFVLTMWAVLWAQVILNHYLGGSWFSVDFVLISTLYFGLARGPMTGQLVGVLLGLLVDAASLGMMGLHALLYAAAGYFSGLSRRQLDETKPWTQGIYTFLTSLVYVALYLSLDRLLGTELRPVSPRFFAQPLANAIAAPFLFWILERWTAAWDIRREELR